MASDPNFSASIAEQAAHWWVVLNDEDVSASEQREFGDWITQGPDRIAAYLRTAMLVKAAKSPSVRWSATSAEELIREAKASHEQGLLPLREFQRPVTHSADRKLSWGRLVMVAATSLLVAVGAAWLVLTSPQEYHTHFGERRSILLEDGSRVALNSESSLKVELHKDHRLVSLDKGEALFQVTRDPTRPFDVTVGGVVVRVVGTEFNIDKAAERTTITVIAGRVAVTPQADSTSTPTVFLDASDRLVVNHSILGTPAHSVNTRVTLAWTENKLVFEHTSVSRAAEEFNRYNRPRIQINGVKLQDREISGVFKSDDPASFLAFLANVPGVRIHDAADGTHIVEQGP